MVEIEAAQEILVGLAIAAVLCGDEAGHDFEHFGRTRQRTILDLLAGDEPGGRGVGLRQRVGIDVLGNMDGTELDGRQPARETGGYRSEQQRGAD